MGRRALAVAGVIVAVLVGGLVWQLRGRASAARRDAATMPLTKSSPPSGSAPVLATPGTTPQLPVEEEAQPQPVPLDPAKAPSLDAPHSKPAPPQKPFTRDETIAKREADLKLLDDTKARLDDELAAARKAGSAADTHDLEIRLARLADLRKKRSAELDTIRSGGTVPE